MPPARNNRKRQWEDLTRQGILDAVVRVLGTHGLPGLTMDKVARQAGVAKGTLYHYFENKQDLVKATLEACINPLVKELNAVLDSSLQSKEKLEKLTQVHLGYFDCHRELFRVLVYDRQFAQARWKRYGSDRYQTFLKKLAAVLSEGCQAGLFKDLDFLKVAAMLVEANIAVIHQRLLCDRPCPLEDDSKMLTQLFLHGILQNPSRIETVP
jgi:AcrR family transcriptional regulator